MTPKLSLVAVFVLLGGATALAQTTTTTVTTTSSAPAVVGTTPVAPPPVDPDDFTRAPGGVTTDAQGKLLIGAPLEVTSSDSLPLSDDLDTLFVIDTGNLKDAGTWTDADRKACSASGGIELEISAGRTACFNL